MKKLFYNINSSSSSSSSSNISSYSSWRARASFTTRPHSLLSCATRLHPRKSCSCHFDLLNIPGSPLTSAVAGFLLISINVVILIINLIWYSGFIWNSMECRRSHVNSTRKQFFLILLITAVGKRYTSLTRTCLCYDLNIVLPVKCCEQRSSCLANAVKSRRKIENKKLLLHTIQRGLRVMVVRLTSISTAKVIRKVKRNLKTQYFCLNMLTWMKQA